MLVWSDNFDVRFFEKETSVPGMDRYIAGAVPDADRNVVKR
jgi:hypothetical protein